MPIFQKNFVERGSRDRHEIAQGGVSVTRTVHQLLGNALSRFVITAVGARPDKPDRARPPC
jgi:hypothetical protein